MSPPPKIGNRGTLCALNSLVQCLFETKDILHILQRLGEYVSPTVRELRDLLMQMCTNDGERVYSTELLAREISRAYSCNLFNQQHDPDVIFGYILDAVKKDGACVDFVKLVEGRTSTCKGCKQANTHPNIHYTLPVSLHASHDTFEMADFIQSDYGKEHNVEQRCSSCSSNACTLKSSVIELPEVMVVKLNRVVSDRNILRKIDRMVCFPRTLDMSPFAAVQAEEQTIYRLYGVIAHEGTPDGGHFTAYVQGDGDWGYANDSYTGSCSWADVVSTYGGDFGHRSELRKSTAYMLMYRKVTDGLIDAGNKQGVNSVLQCLAETVTSEQLLSRSAGAVTKELAGVLKAMTASPSRAVNPKAFIDTLAVQSGLSFKYEEYPDVTLQYIAEALDQEACAFGSSQMRLTTVQLTECPNCNATYSLSEDRIILPVIVKQAGLLACMRDVFENIVTKECVECNSIQSMSAQMKINEPPECMIIRLDRLNESSVVNFPEKFDLSDVVKSTSAVYNLYGVIAQSSDTVIAYTKRNGDWFRKENTRVAKCQWQQITNTYRCGVADEVACMLWYRKSV